MGIKNGSFSYHLKLMYSQFVLYEIKHSAPGLILFKLMNKCRLRSHITDNGNFPLRHSEPFEMILPPRLLHKV